MRVIDFGTVTPLRSQTVWHAVCRAMRPGDSPVLSFVVPEHPYVCLGYHRDPAEVDLDYCRGSGIPVLRRMVGGGPVYCDAQQVFFQITAPVHDVPARRATALTSLLRPAMRALRSLGVPAVLDRFGEISVGPAKVCGHGAGQLGEGVTVVGNLILGFDHDRAARVLRLDPQVREIVAELMRRHVVATVVDPEDWKAAMVAEYSAQFGSAARADELGAEETAELGRLDSRFCDEDFLAGTPRPARPVRTVKIRAGVWVHDWHSESGRVVLGVADDRVELASGREHLVGMLLEDAKVELELERDAAPLVSAIRAAHAEVA